MERGGIKTQNVGQFAGEHRLVDAGAGIRHDERLPEGVCDRAEDGDEEERYDRRGVMAPAEKAGAGAADKLAALEAEVGGRKRPGQGLRHTDSS
jgi:hypothetical protein